MFHHNSIGLKIVFYNLYFLTDENVFIPFDKIVKEKKRRIMVEKFQ